MRGYAGQNYFFAWSLIFKIEAWSRNGSFLDLHALVEEHFYYSRLLASLVEFVAELSLIRHIQTVFLQILSARIHACLLHLRGCNT